MPKNKAQRIFPSSEAFKMIRKLLAFTMSLTLILSGCGQGTTSTPPGNGNANTTPPPTPPTPTTASTAIKHVVVIFGENISFDHYFGTYPNAANTGGTTFTAASGTPTNINNYLSNPSLLTANPNLSSGNGASASNPFRLGPNQAATADQATITDPSRPPSITARSTSSHSQWAPQTAPLSPMRPPHPASRTPRRSPWATTTATLSAQCGTTRSTTL